MIEINLKRLEYLVKLFGFTKETFIAKIQNFYKKTIDKEDIFSNKIKINYLKKIDKEIFKKGLSFYTDPNFIKENNSRLFFRKNNFNSPIELGDRQIISKLEDEISYINGLRVLANEKKLERKIKTYIKRNDPKSIAKEIKKKLYPQKRIKNDRKFLKALIHKFAEKNIFVFEFVEAWNTKEKSNLNGCFISPNYIIIKRQQGSFKREIFTLVHELGHYLLNKEELDYINFENSTREIEKWCNQFAFAFLTDEDDSKLSQKVENFKNDKCLNNLLFLQDYHISRLAFLTHLLDKKEINKDEYLNIKIEIDKEYKKIKKEKERKKKQDKLNGKKGGGAAAVEIISTLKDHIYKSAYFEGVINEAELRASLKLKQRKKYFEVFLYE